MLGTGGALALAVVTLAYRGEGLAWTRAVLAATCFLAPAVLLGVAAWHWAHRHRRSGWLHAGAALGFAGLWTASFALMIHVLGLGSAAGYLRDSAIWQVAWSVVLYASIVTGARMARRLEEQRAAAAAAELVALRAQLSPHFLYNTLQSLTQLAREDPVATAEALETFGGLMRYAIAASGRREVALGDELGFVRGYLALERLRFGDRLAVREDVDDEALDCAVPPLLLQPLVENAVRHGLAPRAGGGAIALRANVAGETLVLEVVDDGVGAAPGSLHDATGLGLAAARRQVAAFGGDAGEFVVDTSPGTGFRACLKMPVRVPRRGAIRW
jgi:LytS/YehU family sensor histidine kinase